MEDDSDAKDNQVYVFSKAINLILNGLLKLNKKATFQIGLGTLAFGIIYWKLSYLGGIEKILISIGVFFITAKIGYIVDVIVDEKIEVILKKSNKTKNNKKLKRF